MTATMLSADQVVLAAYGMWSKTKQTTRQDPDALYSVSLPIRSYTAKDAIHSVWRDSDEDGFWDTADWAKLENRLISYIDSRLAPDSSYQQEMAKR